MTASGFSTWACRNASTRVIDPLYRGEEVRLPAVLGEHPDVLRVFRRAGSARVLGVRRSLSGVRVVFQRETRAGIRKGCGNPDLGTDGVDADDPRSSGGLVLVDEGHVDLQGVQLRGVDPHIAPGVHELDLGREQGVAELLLRGAVLGPLAMDKV